MGLHRRSSNPFTTAPLIHRKASILCPGRPRIHCSGWGSPSLLLSATTRPPWTPSPQQTAQTHLNAHGLCHPQRKSRRNPSSSILPVRLLSPPRPCCPASIHVAGFGRNGGMGMNRMRRMEGWKEDRPYRCRVDGCVKAYKNPGGLKYHMVHGHAEDTGDPEMNHIIQKPYLCPVAACEKRYKNLNGLKYHIEHAHSALVENP
ncbi:hypothetical protein BC829DRAFT_434057 [Chytridium lagenaria]|nr:hypothetical protein BC829DRAFT_434057 [Chytridium lagenaria]